MENPYRGCKLTTRGRGTPLQTVVGDGVGPPSPVVVVGGCTGVGKTAVLQELADRSRQVTAPPPPPPPPGRSTVILRL